MGDEGLAGLRRAYDNEATKNMKKDQEKITNFVIKHLEEQKNNPHKKMIVIKGGPGTGKTILGIRFILEYVRIFNNGKNDNHCIFSLPKSQTVKAMFDSACSADEENENEYCCNLKDIADEQNLVVVDEAHRITELEDKLDTLFNAKETKLLIVLQDDRQMLRPGEEGTYEAFKQYAKSGKINFSPDNDQEIELLILKDEKRCDEKLLKGITKLFYNDENIIIDDPIESIHVFDDLHGLETWKNHKAEFSRTKYIFPFCWKWISKSNTTAMDIVIGDFRRKWNLDDTDEQVIWLKDNTDDRVACIYTSQGLDMDNVAIVWWDDLVWNENEKKWVSNPDKLYDSAFNGIKDHNTGLWKVDVWSDSRKQRIKIEVSQKEMDELIKNTYYVMLSRPRDSVGIWFKDEATKRHVLEVLGLDAEW